MYLCEGQSFVVGLGDDFQQVDTEHIENHALVRAEGTRDLKVVEQLHHPVHPQQPLLVVVLSYFQQQSNFVLGHLRVLY